MEFFSIHCIFWDLQTGKKIGTGRLEDDLYVLDGKPGIDSDQAPLSTNKDVTKEIIQWHMRLGHPSFFHFRAIISQIV